MNDHIHRVTCLHGHMFTPENTYVNPKGARVCRTCVKNSQKRFSERLGVKHGLTNRQKIHCPQGHPYDEKNTYLQPTATGGTQRRCRACIRARNAISNSKRVPGHY